ncbi:MAG: sodium:solute symporter family protein [Planctomycetota bacterium]|nr:sodium:solute symporter family protein [Planctomycetota bacterium]
MLLAQAFSVLDILLILVYLGACAYLGWLGYRHTKTVSDYLIAGRKVHPFIMAMSYGSTFISTSAIVGFGGAAGLFGMSVLWLTVLNIFVGIFIAFVVLGGPTRRIGHRLDAHTFAELLGRRFNSKAIQICAGLIIFLFMPLYAAAVLIGGTEFLATAFFPNDYTLALFVFGVLTAVYVFFGGLKGVLYTDALQGTIMTLGMLFLLVSAYWWVGGPTQGHKDLAEAKDYVFAGLSAQGHQGWTSMPQFGWGIPAGLPPGAPSPYNLWWIVITTIVMGVGIGVLAQPQLVVRFLTVKSGKEINRALAIGGSFILMMTGVAFTVGALSNIYFIKHEQIKGRIVGTTESAKVILKKDPGQDAKTLPCKILHIDTTGDGVPNTFVVEKVLLPPNALRAKWMPNAEVISNSDGTVIVRPHTSSFLRAVVKEKDDKGNDFWSFNSDNIIPAYVTSAMPRWFKVIFLLTLLSAAMSTMSSQYHTLGSALGRDVFETILGPSNPGSMRTIHAVRIGIIAGLVLAMLIGYYARGGYVIARYTAIFFGLCASSFLPTFVGGLYFKRITKAGALASMAVGFVTTAFWVVFVKEAEAGAIGLVRHLTPLVGTSHPNSILYNHPNWPSVDPLLVALPLSILTCVVVSLVTQKPDAALLDKCFASSGSLSQANEKLVKS